MTESEMIRCPESWQLDFQPSLKWDYCHGLELQAMLDVYDAYGDKKIYDYAYAYADTMIQADGSIKTYKLSEYNIDRLNSGKFLFRIFEQSKEEKFQKAIDLLRSQLDTHPRNADGGFWHKKYILTKCGSTDFTWEHLSTLSMRSEIAVPKIIKM
jgi:unsaturated rhamnogalacturonyl hydrolase